MLKNKFLLLVIGLLTFINIYYELNPFAFNATTNNIEELPFIYKLTGLAEYPHDSYVKLHTSNFTQITPYVSFISLLVKMFELKDLTILFFTLHAIVLSLLYLSIRQIYKYLSDIPESLIMISILSLNLLLKVIYFIPNNRTLFYDFLDPEFLTYPLLLFTIGFHLKKRFLLAALYLFLATIVHPLYALPLIPALIISQIKNTRIHLFYLLATLPYTIFLWAKSRQTINSNLDASMINEIIRAPHHYKIPVFFSFDYSVSIFYLVSFLLIGIGYFFIKNKPSNTSSLSLIKINFLLISILLITSLISCCIRIPILIQLTPYRIGIIIVILSWIIFFHSCLNNFHSIYSFFKKFDLAIMSVLLVGSLAACFKSETITIPNKDFTYRSEAISWIKNNTQKDSLFLNYSDLDIRTETFRSDYFGFQTSPLIADGQIDWYREFLAYYDVPNTIPETEYSKAKAYASSIHTINIANVINKSKSPINYVVILRNKIPFSKVTELVNLSNKSYTYNTSGLILVFENNKYFIFKRVM